MTKALAKKQNTEVAGFDDSEFAGIEAEQKLSANDVVVPKVLIMQPGSPRVLDGDAKFGQLVDTLNWEVLTEVKGTPMQVIPFHWKKLWIIRKFDDGQWKFTRIEEMTRHNENLDAYETWDEAGTEHKREYAHFFQVLIENRSLPYTLCFRGGSRKAGEALVTQMYVTNKMLKTEDAYKRSPMGAVIAVSLVKETNKAGKTFCKLEVKREREVTKEEAMEALNWFKTISAGDASVDYSDEVKEEVKEEPLKGAVSDEMSF